MICDKFPRNKSVRKSAFERELVSIDGNCLPGVLLYLLLRLVQAHPTTTVPVGGKNGSTAGSQNKRKKDRPCQGGKADPMCRMMEVCHFRDSSSNWCLSKMLNLRSQRLVFFSAQSCTFIPFYFIFRVIAIIWPGWLQQVKLAFNWLGAAILLDMAVKHIYQNKRMKGEWGNLLLFFFFFFFFFFSFFFCQFF